MMKLLMKALLLMIITTKLNAFDPRHLQIDTSSNVDKALSVVEVLGESRGSGVLVAMEDKVVIVTNSHNLQGKSTAMVNLPKHQLRYYILQPAVEMSRGFLGFEGMAKVLHDFPLSDVAILELPEGISPLDKAILYHYAISNGLLHPKNGWTPGNRSLSFNDNIGAILQGKPVQIKAIEGFKGATTPDIYISGDGNPIWVIPVFAKPGVSGGGYYRNGVLTGLVTKISLAGEPVALATPFSKIGKLLYSNDSFERQVSWENGLMVYKTKDKTLTINPLGNGGLGNGGELTEVDESKSGDSNPDYWRLEINTFGGNRTITTWDPFVYRPGNFSVNQDDVGFIKVKDKGLFKSRELYRVPTLASYIASEKKGEAQTFLKNTAQNLLLLKEARLKKKTNISFARMYTHDYGRNSYRIYNLRYDNVNGAQPIRPLANGRWAPAQRHNPWSGPKPIIELDAKVTTDKEGYFFNMPFSSKISDSMIFDVKFSGEFIGLRTHSAYLKAPADLSRVILMLKGSEGVETEIILRPVEFNSANSLVFKSDDDAYKIIYLYSNNDLSQLARIYFVNESSLMEFWGN